MTPDPITTAREAAHDLWLRAQAVTCEIPKRQFIEGRYNSITAALDYAETLQAAKWAVKHTDTMNDMVAMGLARDAAYAEIEKLKAERDEARKEANNAVKSAHGHAVNLNKIITAILPRGPMCRDCADEDGTCPHNDGLPCDPYDEVVERFRRLTSQLDQAERVMEYAGDVRWLELAQGSPFTTIDRQMLHEMHSRASQWIKDRHEKQALSELHTEEKRLGLE